MSRTLSALIVEDDELIRDVLEDHLKALRLFRSIVHAENGQQAFERMDRQEFDVILCDINMPKLNGIEMIERYLQQHPAAQQSKPPFILVSGNIDHYVLEKAMEFGVRDVLTKPVDGDKFQAKLKSFLKERGKIK